MNLTPGTVLSIFLGDTEQGTLLWHFILCMQFSRLKIPVLATNGNLVFGLPFPEARRWGDPHGMRERETPWLYQGARMQTSKQFLNGHEVELNVESSLRARHLIEWAPRG